MAAAMTKSVMAWLAGFSSACLIMSGFFAGVMNEWAAPIVPALLAVYFTYCAWGKGQ
jgi:hypothetical protein